jgi:hypothetical protein
LWHPFAVGCWFVKWGIVAELVALGLLFVLLELRVLDVTNVIQLPPGFGSVGLSLVVFVPVALGTLLIAIGRVLMVRVPPGAQGAVVLIVAAGLSWLRFVLVVLTIVFLVLGLCEGANPARDRYFDWTVSVCVLAGFAGLVADLSTIPALAVVGGEMPSRALRTKALAVTFVIQLRAALWVAVIVGLAYVDAMREFVPALAPQPGPRPPGAQLQRVDPAARAVRISIALAVLFALEIGYGHFQYSLYSAGRAAGQSDGDRDS